MIMRSPATNAWLLALLLSACAGAPSKESAAATEEEFQPADHRPVLSPDGRSLVFMSNRFDQDWELLTMQIDGSGLRRLTEHTGWDGYAVFRPDGGAFFFDRQTADGKAAHRYILSSGAIEAVLTMPGAWPAVTHWHPHGDRIALFIERDKQRDLYLANADGSDLRQLTDTPEQNEHEARFSPDGSRLAYAVVLEDGSALEIMDLASGAVTRRLTSPSYLYGLDWSPDGARIAYTASPAETQEIFMVEVAGGDPVQLTDNDAIDHMPVWLPDGRRLLFSSYRSGAERIYELNVETRQAKPFSTGLL